MKNKPKSDRQETMSATLLAYKLIKEKVLDNELSSKQRLKEAIFVKNFNLSRTPIREALIMLEKEDLVARDEGKGFHIKQFSMRDINDLYQFREVLEKGAAHLVISKVTDENIDELSMFLEQIQTIIKKGDITKAFVKAVQFHREFNSLCGNSLMIKAMNECYDKLTLIGWSCQKLDMCIKSSQEHEEILAALSKRDGKKLQEKIVTHISEAKDRAINILKNDAEKWYFMP